MRRQKKPTAAEMEKLIAQLHLTGDTAEVLAITRDETMPKHTRFEAAKVLLPYFHTPISIDDDEDADD